MDLTFAIGYYHLVANIAGAIPPGPPGVYTNFPNPPQV